MFARRGTSLGPTSKSSSSRSTVIPLNGPRGGGRGAGWRLVRGTLQAQPRRAMPTEGPKTFPLMYDALRMRYACVTPCVTACVTGCWFATPAIGNNAEEQFQKPSLIIKIYFFFKTGGEGSMPSIFHFCHSRRGEPGPRNAWRNACVTHALRIVHEGEDLWPCTRHHSPHHAPGVRD